jgi:hypothetical protein
MKVHINGPVKSKEESINYKLSCETRVDKVMYFI